jgi:lipopolysaccharide/colanic/teichoic acid biosynthesis glycosyltransferase
MGVGSLERTGPDAGLMGDADLRTGLVIKRAIDVVVSFSLLVVLAPTLLLIAVAILVLDGRPIFYRQERVGRFGTLFTIYKFRTMVPDAHERLDEIAHTNERTGPLFKAADDPRVTTVGRFLRRTSLDELPQLFNVVRGQMSLVGPRPSLPEERAQFPAELLEREHLPQGLTGLWQLEGRNNSDFAVYRDLDLDYVRTWALHRDLWILLRTPFVIVRHALRSEARSARAIPSDAVSTVIVATAATEVHAPRSGRDRSHCSSESRLAVAAAAGGPADD